MKDKRLSLRGLGVQILLWVTLPFILLLIAFSLTGIRSHQQSMRTLVAERDLGLARALAHDVANLLDRYRIPLAFLAQILAEQPDDVSRRLKAARQQIAADVDLVVVDSEGQVSASTGPTAWVARRASHLNENVSVGVLHDERKSYIVWQFPLQDGGILFARLPLDALNLAEVLQAGYSNQVGHALLIDSMGHVLALSGRPLTAEEHTALPQEIRSQQSGVVFIPTPAGELVIAHAPVPNTEWHVLVREPWETLAAPLLHFDRVMPFVLLSATVISLLALFFGLRYVVAPLQRLREQAERIGMGDFRAARLPVGGVQEIEDLRQALDRMAQQVADYQAALQIYLKMLTRVQEEERSRLARELHDGTVQTLIALGQRLQMVQRELRRAPEQATERLAALRSMVSEAIEDVRRFTRALRPLYLEELGLIPALEMLTREAGAAFQVHGQPIRLSDEIELALFRIAQEALSNAQRHAQATHIAVWLSFDNGQVRLVVQDDGRGFHPPERLVDLVQRGHLGLMSMQERAQGIGGRLHIRSHPGRGTRVEVIAPLQ